MHQNQQNSRSPYQRNVQTLLDAAQAVELGEKPDTDIIILAQNSLADEGTLGIAAHLVLYGERARDARQSGFINAAMGWEAERDKYYARLPEGLRW